MPSPTPVPGNVERAHSGKNLIAPPATWNIGTVRQRGQRIEQRLTIGLGLPHAKGFYGPLEDLHQIAFRSFAQTDVPAALDQARDASGIREYRVRDLVQVGGQGLGVGEFLVRATFQRPDSGGGGLAQGR